MPASAPTDWYRWDGDDLILAVHIQPGARSDGIAGLHGDRLKIRITAPPVDGKANTHLRRYLADRFGVAASAVELLAGTSGRDKRVRVRSPRRLLPGIPAHPGT
ncbi:MAG: DUF167 family protein [Gammaproteobacteria bacterium]|nr:DUF167 family protein [Gammaproteobacteria bacterium]